ncbi:hypothetical protein ANCCEY_09982 [Ancylostoma ceylanicum]|uniref:PID domain-containing protein n=1 Tax=Ancylostoma ceylanicum TaxID=53326 RepID=A0A0D6LFS5_9BILA|nr:hypothetical protein ANCCEY_09982 [Ancylostoma ceylanicum]
MHGNCQNNVTTLGVRSNPMLGDKDSELSIILLNCSLVVQNMPVLNSSTSASHFFTFPFRRKKQRYTINPPDVCYNVIYLGNVLTVMAGGEHCFEKPLALIWKAYCSRTDADLNMGLEITRSGLKAETKEQGLTEYWAHRITCSGAPPHYPKIFCWIYKHDGKRREKLAVQNARLTGSAGCPRRKRLLHTGSLNFRPPVCRSKSAPRLGSIDEEQEEPESDNESVCYRAEPDRVGRTSSDPTSDAASGENPLERSEAEPDRVGRTSSDPTSDAASGENPLERSEGAAMTTCCGCFEEEQRQARMSFMEYDSISDESGYHEDRLVRGHSEESYYSDGELVMLEEDYDDSEEQITPL